MSLPHKGLLETTFLSLGSRPGTRGLSFTGIT